MKNLKNIEICTFSTETSYAVVIYEAGDVIYEHCEELDPSEPYRLVLEAALNGISSLQDPSAVSLYTPSSWVAENINDGPLNGIRYRHLWDQFFGIIDHMGHDVEAVLVDPLVAKMQVGYVVTMPAKSKDVEEVWREVSGTKGMYKVSNTGRILSHHKGRRRAKDGFLKPCFHKKATRADGSRRGYYHVRLYIPGQHKPLQRRVDHLVLEAFCGPRPKGLESCHWDDDSANNDINNLRWDSPASNRFDRRFTDHNASRVQRIVPGTKQMYWCPVFNPHFPSNRYIWCGRMPILL